MLGGNDGTLFYSSRHERTSGKIIGASEKTAGALLYCGDSLFRKEALFTYNATWLTITSGSSGNGAVNYTGAENTTGKQRTGKIKEREVKEKRVKSSLLT